MPRQSARLSFQAELGGRVQNGSGFVARRRYGNTIVLSRSNLCKKNVDGSCFTKVASFVKQDPNA